MINRTRGRASARAPGRGAHQAVGLHGHHLHGDLWRAVSAEAAGTFFLVLVITATAIAAALGRRIVAQPYGSMTMPLVAGMVLAALVASLGPISGAHLNPAVTAALALHGRFPWRRVPAYAAAQLAGAIAAALVAWVCYGDQARSATALGATLPAPDVGPWQAFGTEAVGTTLLILVIVSVATNSQAPASGAVPIGFALAATIFAAGPLTGAAVNPARALGPMVITGRFTDWWCYLLAPFLGAAIAVTFHERVLSPSVPDARR